MNSDKIIFADESLEESFKNLNENDPIKKAIIKAIENIEENCY